MCHGCRLVQVLALTLGEPAGIGPDLALAIWRRRAELDLPPFYIVADPEFLRRRAAILGLDVPIVSVTAATAAAAFHSALPVLPLDIAVTAEPGRPDGSSAPAAVASIRRAVADVMAGAAAAIVTNPDCQERALQLGLCRARPYRVPGDAGAGSDRRLAAAGDDVVVAGTRGRAGHDPLAAPRHLQAPFDRAHCGNRTHRRARSCDAL